MRIEAVSLKIQRWVDLCDNAILDLLPLHSILAPLESEKVGEIRSILALSTACLQSSGSILVLVENERLWDAEILNRTVCEGTIKFLYILQSPDYFQERSTEYSEVLPDLSALRSDFQAREVLKHFPEEGCKPLEELLLSGERRQELLQRWPRRTRKVIEQRWSFTELVSHLSSSVSEFSAILHTYGIASHVAHLDYEGAAMQVERDSRSMERKTAIHIAHAAKLISNVYTFAIFRLLAAYKFMGIDPQPVFETRNRYVEVLMELSRASVEWEAVEYPEKAS